MMLNLGKSSVARERNAAYGDGIWLGAEFGWLYGVVCRRCCLPLVSGDHETAVADARMIAPKEVGIALYTQYVLAVELGGRVAARRAGWRVPPWSSLYV